MTSSTARAKADDKLKLPSGGWARLRKFEHLRTRDMKQVRQEVRDDSSTNPTDIMNAALEALVKILVCEWSIPYPSANGDEWPLPSVDASTLDDLEVRDYNALMVAAEPALESFSPPRL